MTAYNKELSNSSPLSDKLLVLPFIFMIIFGYHNNVSIQQFLLYLLPAIWTADLFSGVYHILSDNYFGSIEPFRAIADSSRHHHKEPAAMIHSPIKEHFKEAIFNNIPLYTISIPLSFYSENFALFLLMTSLLGSFAQLSHKYSHMRLHRVPLPPGVRFLQNIRLLLHPNAHKQHHTTYDKNFAVLNSWSSFVTNRLFKFLTSTSSWYQPLGFDFSTAH